MSLETQIMDEMKNAMRAKDTVALEALRAIKSGIILAKTEAGAGDTLSADDEIKILQRLVKQRKDSAAIFQSGYKSQGWVKAIVPGTVFSSYVAAGLEKDPNFGDNIYKVDKKKYDRNFWYRTEFKIPAS